MSHHGLTRACRRLPEPPLPPGSRTRKARPMKSRPSANLAGTDGSRGPSRSHSHAKIGASTITKNGWTDWNQDDGNAKPKQLESRVAIGEQVRASNPPARSRPRTGSRRGRR